MHFFAGAPMATPKRRLHRCPTPAAPRSLGRRLLRLSVAFTVRKRAWRINLASAAPAVGGRLSGLARRFGPTWAPGVLVTARRWAPRRPASLLEMVNGTVDPLRVVGGGGPRRREGARRPRRSGRPPGNGPHHGANHQWPARRPPELRPRAARRPPACGGRSSSAIATRAHCRTPLERGGAKTRHRVHAWQAPGSHARAPAAST
jgi:hypothetical protein